MKIKKADEKPEGFKPVSLTFTFETQAELDAFGRLFNCGAVTRVLKNLGVKPPSESGYFFEPFDEVGAILTPSLYEMLEEEFRS